MFMGANGALVKERISRGLRMFTKLVECLWLQKGALVNERISLGLRMFAKLVEC